MDFIRGHVVVQVGVLVLELAPEIVADDDSVLLQGADTFDFVAHSCIVDFFLASHMRGWRFVMNGVGSQLQRSLGIAY